MTIVSSGSFHSLNNVGDNNLKKINRSYVNCGYEELYRFLFSVH